MRKKILVFVILLSLLLASCRNPVTYNFLNPTNEISGISIVALSFDDDRKLIETEIQKIEDVGAFIEDFQGVHCFTYFGDPTGATPEGVEDTVIKISYANDEYELINWNGQSKYTIEKGFTYYAGYNIFDEQAFESLIEEYLPHRCGLWSVGF